MHASFVSAQATAVKEELIPRMGRFAFATVAHEWQTSPQSPMPRFIRHFSVLCLGLWFVQSCQTVKFYGQAAGGQFEILRKSRPIPPIIADPQTDPKLRKQLVAVQGIRQFAENHLSLPGSESYGTYADLGREYVTWVLYASPEFSLKPRTWWYPLLGHLDYRGFFNEEDANQLAIVLREKGDDVEIGGVDAYSTLGWFHDPVLNCFVRNSDIYLAELIFHELTHRRLFRRGDTAFNESLASAYSEEGVKRWLIAQKRNADLLRYEKLLVRRSQFYDQIDSARRQLERLYASGKSIEQMRREKAGILHELRENFRDLRRRWGGHGLESWLNEDLNNAHLVSIITYQKNVPVFHQLLKDCGGDVELFFERATRLKLEK
ncbi:MAG: aminopeptidase [Luteolibacter sp.]